MKIYSRAGDTGATGRIGGGRLSKNSVFIHAIGDVDELNSVVGLARTLSSDDNLSAELSVIQNELFDLGAELAAIPEQRKKFMSISSPSILRLEEAMDLRSEQLPPLTQFILPGGTQLAASLHHSRSVCRRAERTVVELHHHEPVRDEVRSYLNRLSDWFFVAARWVNAQARVEDIVWVKAEER